MIKLVHKIIIIAIIILLGLIVIWASFINLHKSKPFFPHSKIPEAVTATVNPTRAEEKNADTRLGITSSTLVHGRLQTNTSGQTQSGTVTGTTKIIVTDRDTGAPIGSGEAPTSGTVTLETDGNIQADLHSDYTIAINVPQVPKAFFDTSLTNSGFVFYSGYDPWRTKWSILSINGTVEAGPRLLGIDNSLYPGAGVRASYISSKYEAFQIPQVFADFAYTTRGKVFEVGWNPVITPVNILGDETFWGIGGRAFYIKDKWSFGCGLNVNF